MNKAIASVILALTAPLAFAQTSTTTEQTTTTTSPAASTSTTTESTTYSSGTVTTYTPGKTIVVNSDQGPVSFALGTTARVLDATGKVITAPIRSGQKVRVYYSGTGDQRTVDHVVVED